MRKVSRFMKHQVHGFTKFEGYAACNKLHVQQKKKSHKQLTCLLTHYSWGMTNVVNI